jgi:glucose dehydrogenase
MRARGVKGLGLLCASLWLAGCAVAHADAGTAAHAQADIAPAEVVSKKRAAPPRVEPVEHAGVRYSEVRGKRVPGAAHQGGAVQAVDLASGKVLWVVQVYSVAADPDMEADKGDVFITRMRLDASQQHLLIRNERGERYVLDLATHQVHREAGAP